jgi:hypothetical protein
MDKIRINLEITKETLKKIDAILLPRQSRVDFVRQAIAQAILNSLNSPDPRRAEANRRKGIAVATSPTAIPPLQGRE